VRPKRSPPRAHGGSLHWHWWRLAGLVPGSAAPRLVSPAQKILARRLPTPPRLARRLQRNAAGGFPLSISALGRGRYLHLLAGGYSAAPRTAAPRSTPAAACSAALRSAAAAPRSAGAATCSSLLGGFTAGRPAQQRFARLLLLPAPQLLARWLQRRRWRLACSAARSLGYSAAPHPAAPDAAAAAAPRPPSLGSSGWTLKPVRTEPADYRLWGRLGTLCLVRV